MSKKERLNVLEIREKVAQVEEKDWIFLQQTKPLEEVERNLIYKQRQKQQDCYDPSEVEKR